jgi:hypothetical protein
MVMELINYKGFDFLLANRNQYASLYFNEALKLAICKATEEYIPISYFKEMFLSVAQIIEKTPVQHFIFDKSMLKTFHQPSMEWYFAEWKPAVKKHGLTNHYKILPKLDWFVKSVEAGRAEIVQKYGANVIEGITITYIDSVENAIAQIIINY